MAKKNIEHFNFSAYETGIKKPTIGTKYTLNGLNNENFKRYQDAVDDSPTNSFITKTIVNYIIGDGLVDKNGLLNPHDYLSKSELRLLVSSFKTYGSAYAQVISVQKKVSKILHTPVLRIGLGIDQDNRNDTFMEVVEYWYSWDFSDKYRFTPRPYAKFSETQTDNAIEILHLKTLSSEPYFPFPDWFSGLKSARIESALIDDALNHVTRGFQGKTIINVNNIDLESEEEKEAISKDVRDNYTGTNNSDGVILSLNKSAMEAITVDTIEPRGRNEQFLTYDEACEIKLMSAHSAMNILFSRPGSNGFSNNADEIATATDSLYLGVINPIREEFLSYLNKIFKKINPNSDIDFINFNQEKVITNE